MTPIEIQGVFGKDRAKVYEFTDSVPAGENPQVYITVKFAEAINDNLVDSIVTELQGVWYVYTKTAHTLSGTGFGLVLELPLPEPEPVEVPAEPTPEEPA